MSKKHIIVITNLFSPDKAMVVKNFSDENVKKEPIVKKYYNSMTDLMKKLHPNATQIIKASSGNSIIAQIEKHIFVKNSTGKAIDVHKNVVLMIYHPKPGHKESNEWENTRSKWEFWRDKYLAPQGIHVSEIVLPKVLYSGFERLWILFKFGRY